MKTKFVVLAAGLAIVVFGIYYQDHIVGSEPRVAGVTYDRTIKVGYGQPIKVAEVVDGDTITLANGERLRYIGIDTPEEVDKRKPVQCFAREAAEKNKELVEGKTIKFYKDVSEKDQYGRWLGFVYLEDGTFVNLELVKQGYAFAYRYPPDISKTQEFHDTETYARTNQLGLWDGQCSVSKLKSGREQTNPVE
jgi:micrococcal nuclease